MRCPRCEHLKPSEKRRRRRRRKKRRRTITRQATTLTTQKTSDDSWPRPGESCASTSKTRDYLPTQAAEHRRAVAVPNEGRGRRCFHVVCRCCVKRRKRQKHQAPSVKRSSSVKGVKRLRTRQLIPARLAIWKQEQAIRAAGNFERESRAVPSYRYIIRAFACKDRIFCARNTSSACAQTATTDAHTRRGGLLTGLRQRR